MNLAIIKKQIASLLKIKTGKRPLTTADLIWILLGFFLITLMLTCYLIISFWTTGAAEQIRIEIIKSLLQVLVVILIGSTVAALFKAYERTLEKEKIRTQMKLDFINRIGKLYRRVKKSRRLLRSRKIVMSKNDKAIELDSEQIRFYSKQMLKLNDVQLELEGFKISAMKSPLFENNQQIIEHLKRMESYLNKIIKQFEKKHQSMAENKKVHFEDFKFLWEFTACSKNDYLKSRPIYNSIESDKEENIYYCFKKLFSVSYGNLLRELT